jgi:hypothetical protein
LSGKLRKLAYINTFKTESGYQLRPAWKNIIHIVHQERGYHNHTLPTLPRTERGKATTPKDQTSPSIDHSTPHYSRNLSFL